MVEIWKTVNDFEGIYKVSSLGRVWVNPCVRTTSAGRKRKFGGKFLRSEPNNSKAYPWVTLCHPLTRVRRNVTIHLLVAETFLGAPPTSEHEVNHIDGNKKNPNIKNLEWITHPDNCKHAYRIGLRDRSCRFVTFKGRTMKVMDWARELNLKPQNIYVKLDNGYPIEAALDTTKILSKRFERLRRSRGIRAAAKRYKFGRTSKMWARQLGITRLAFLWRLRKYKGRDDLIYHKGKFPRKGQLSTS